jgi:hypothetical protein
VRHDAARQPDTPIDLAKARVFDVSRAVEQAGAARAARRLDTRLSPAAEGNDAVLRQRTVRRRTRA